MTRRFGIDTSVLVRLLTGEPAEDFAYCVTKLSALVEEDGAEIFASNQVIGEAYVAVQHHYGVSKADARRRFAGRVAQRAALPAERACGLLSLGDFREPRPV